MAHVKRDLVDGMFNGGAWGLREPRWVWIMHTGTNCGRGAAPNDGSRFESRRNSKWRAAAAMRRRWEEIHGYIRYIAGTLDLKVIEEGPEDENWDTGMTGRVCAIVVNSGVAEPRTGKVLVYFRAMHGMNVKRSGEFETKICTALALAAPEMRDNEREKAIQFSEDAELTVKRTHVQWDRQDAAGEGDDGDKSVRRAGKNGVFEADQGWAVRADGVGVGELGVGGAA
ncbi:hypothetical protein DFH09DRAFT_1068562 [Mycena vulgaris]|nr:hypothetical protein DFH09DRAFT_1068562 [Mycena vulgaris]